MTRRSAALRAAPVRTSRLTLGLLCLGLGACGSESKESRTNPGATSAGSGPNPETSEAQSAPAAPVHRWPNEAAARGLDYHNRSGEPAKATILEANGAGVAMLDLEADGDLDVVFTQGMDSLQAALAGPGADLAVYRNDGKGQFERLPGPGLSGWWTGLATGDVDGDGRADLIAGGYGGLRVLLQNERGELIPGAELLPQRERFQPGEARKAGTSPQWITSLALFDADGDGRLDLYAGHYLAMDPVAPILGEIKDGSLGLPCRWKGYEVYCGPRGLPPQADRIYRGSGDGNFEARTAEWLPDHVAGFTLALLPTDVDGDGDTDVFVANDSSANLLLVNDGTGVLHDHGYEAGIAFSADGNPEAGMGVAVGDVNRDGLFDYAVTNFSEEPTALYFGSPLGFNNVTFRFGLGGESRALLSWSTHIEDFDGDTWLELFTANGHVYPQADNELTGTRYAQRDSLWRLGPHAKAVRVEPGAPDSILALEVGTRGTALGDVNGDGAPDLILNCIDAPCALGINQSGPSAQRLVLQLSAPPVAEREAQRRYTPRDGMGARVVLVVGKGDNEFALMKEVQTCQGYQSASSPNLHFGLGELASYESLEVRWPSGAVTQLPGGPANRFLHVEEGRGLISSRELR